VGKRRGVSSGGDARSIFYSNSSEIGKKRYTTWIAVSRGLGSDRVEEEYYREAADAKEYHEHVYYRDIGLVPIGSGKVTPKYCSYNPSG